LITGVDDKSHLDSLAKVLQRLGEKGVRLKLVKCKFFLKQVEWMGFLISEEGVSTISEKVRPILEAQTPENLGQLKSFLGMLQYYHRYFPNVSDKLEPLHALLRKNVKWKWDESQEVRRLLLKRQKSYSQGLSFWFIMILKSLS
jgi:hypothetical protein